MYETKDSYAWDFFELFPAYESIWFGYMERAACRQSAVRERGTPPYLIAGFGREADASGRERVALTTHLWAIFSTWI